MTFQKGQSGNPNGRPPKNRAWTAILDKAGSVKLDYGEHRLARKQLIAEYVMQAVTTGRVTFPDGRVLELSPHDWMDMVWKAYGQVDGPPRGEVDITSGSEPLKFPAPAVFLPAIEPNGQDDPR